MSDQTPLLHLPLLAAAQAQKHVTVNEALLTLDGLTHICVERQCAAPPGAPSLGARYLIGASASGLFAGRENAIAIYEEGGWRICDPAAGWLMWRRSDNALLVFDGALWRDAPIRYAEQLGVGATADEVNRLSVRTPAALFSNAGDDIRVKLNKNDISCTASLLYQTNWSGRAEIGLSGDDRLHVKVSSDGQAWKEAALFDGATGAAYFPQGIAGGDRMGFRNKLRNATFAINQRGVSGAVTLAANAYGHDGVKAGANGATYTFAASGLDVTLIVSLGSLILPVEANLIEGGDYALTHEGTAAARIWQGASAGAGVFQNAARAQGGARATNLLANTQTNVEFGPGTILRPQLESGLWPSPFERLPFPIVQEICGRYFERLTLVHPAVQVSSTIIQIPLAFRFQKRVAPNAWLTGSVTIQGFASGLTATVAGMTVDGVVCQILRNGATGTSYVVTSDAGYALLASAEI